MGFSHRETFVNISLAYSCTYIVVLMLWDSFASTIVPFFLYVLFAFILFDLLFSRVTPNEARIAGEYEFLFEEAFHRCDVAGLSIFNERISHHDGVEFQHSVTNICRANILIGARNK